MVFEAAIMTLLVLGAAALVACAYFLGKFESARPEYPIHVEHAEVPCPDKNEELSNALVTVTVHNNVPKQAQNSKAMQNDCWLIGIYAAGCSSPQSPSYHQTHVQWHEEDETQQSQVRYYDILDSTPYLRWTRGGFPSCEHHDYYCNSWFSYTPGAQHTTRIEQWDLRPSTPVLANWSEAVFHPT